MKRLFAVLVLVVATVNVRALTDAEVNLIVNKIYLVEGGDKAKVPYGILSIKVRDKEHARRICENTVRNNWRRWNEAGKPGRYFDYLGNRYCPVSHDRVGNRNWIRNIRALTKLPY
jgi:hypothetical protein